MDLLDSHRVSCPYCGELIDILVDCSVPLQQYVEDCSVCCSPMLILVECTDQQPASVLVKREDE